MENVVSFLDAYGYWLLLALGFAEFSGVPIASVPALIAAGGLAAAGGLSLPAIAASAAIGGLLADLSWFGLARWQGRRLVGAACSLTSNPRACVQGVQSRLARVGDRYILYAKFLPGAANLIAPAAGLRGVPFRRFLALDAIALLAWASFYTALGWLLSDQVERVITLAVHYSRWSFALLFLLLVGAGALRLVKVHRHRQAHERADGPPREPDRPMETR